MIDCDIYSSARTALDFCGPLIRDRAVLVFDDWPGDAGGEAAWGTPRVRRVPGRQPQTSQQKCVRPTSARDGLTIWGRSFSSPERAATLPMARLVIELSIG